jgi:hypothetical protein
MDICICIYVHVHIHIIPFFLRATMHRHVNTGASECLYCFAHKRAYTSVYMYTCIYGRKLYQSRTDRVKAHPPHVGHARNVPLADVAVEGRPCGTRCRGGDRWIEQVRHARHRCGVPVGDRTVRRRRGRRIGHPRNHGRAQVCIGDGCLRSDERGEKEEHCEAHEEVRPQWDGPSAKKGATRRAAPPCDTLQRGMCYIIVQRRNTKLQR